MSANKMNSVKEIKARINSGELYPIKHHSEIPKLVKAGKLPETQAHMEYMECDLRSVSPWVKAFYELQYMPILDRYQLID